MSHNIGLSYTGKCPDGTPQHRITGNRYISERIPGFFDCHENRSGYDWQVCVKCGDAFETRISAVSPIPESQKAPPEAAKRGAEFMPPQLNHQKRNASAYFLPSERSAVIVTDYPGYVTTTVAAFYLGVQRPQIREYIKAKKLDAVMQKHRGSDIWLVSIDSLSEMYGRRYGADFVGRLIAGLEKDGFTLAQAELDKRGIEARRKAGEGSNLAKG